jgi:hypothetical protein
MTEAEIKDILEKINWDTPRSTDDLYKEFTGEKVENGIGMKWFYIKLWKQLYFQEMYKLLGDEKLKDALSDEVIKGVHPQGYRNRLFNAKRILYS